MKATPRKAENVVALQLSEFFLELGLDPVERQPITGRTGPDITMNDFKLAVDVKSRIAIPLSWLAGPGEEIYGDGMVGVRISDVGKLGALQHRHVRTSILVKNYLNHQEEWTSQKCKNGISAIAIRRPGMKSAATTFIIYEEKLNIWLDRVQKFRLLAEPK